MLTEVQPIFDFRLLEFALAPCPGVLLLLPEDLLGCMADDVRNISIEDQPLQIGVVDAGEQVQPHVNGCARVVGQRPIRGKGGFGDQEASRTNGA